MRWLVLSLKRAVAVLAGRRAHAHRLIAVAASRVFRRLGASLARLKANNQADQGGDKERGRAICHGRMPQAFGGWGMDYLTFCKRLQTAFLAVLFLSAAATAQTTVVTGTVVDPNGVPYAGGTVLPQLVPAGGATPTLNGAFFVPSSSPARLDSNGVFSLTVQDNNQISPAGSQWKFTVCSAAGTVPIAGGKGPVCFNDTLTITGASQDITANLQASALSLTTASTATIAKRIYVDGVKYPISQAGIQAALTDACAGTLGGAHAGAVVYLPPMNLTVSSTTGQQFLATCSLQIIGSGQYQTVISVTLSNSTTPVFRIQPTSIASQLRGRISGMQITGDSTGGDAFLFDGSNIALGANGGPNGWDVDHNFVTGLAAAAHSVNLVDCTATCNQGYFHVWDNQFNHGTKWAGSAGDSILLEHNVFTANGVTTACAEVTQQAGSAHFTMFNNNGACTGGFFIAHRADQPKILYNQIEQTEATTEANSAVVDLQGDIATVDGAEIIGNNINQHSNATNGVRVAAASNTTIMDNVIGIKPTTGVGVLITTGATKVRMPFNEFSGTGGGAVAYANASSLTTLAIQGPDGLASSPTYSFINSPTDGIWDAQSGLIFTVGGSNIFYIPPAVNSQVVIGSGRSYAWSSATDPTAAGDDTNLSRGAAGVVDVGTGSAGSTAGEIRSAKIAATYNAAGTLQTAVHIVQDTCTLGTNCAVTLTGSAAYTSSSSYHCTAADATTAAAVKVAQASGSSVTFTGTGTDVVNFICVGN